MARLLLLWLALCGLARAAPPLVFDAAEFAATSDARPPAANAAWRALPLPDLWRVHHPATLEHGWYRVRFARPADDAPLALYLPRLGMNAALWLNGHPLGDGGRMDEPLARNWNRPLLFVLPRERLTEHNTLTLHLRGNAHTQAGLFPFQLGEVTPLRAAYEHAYFYSVSLNQSATLLIAFVGVLMLSLWARRRQDKAYLLFGIAAWVWALQSTNLYWREPPFTTAQWETLVNASFEVFAALLLASLLRFVGVWRDAYRAGFLLLLVGAPATLPFAPPAHFLQITAVWHFVTVLATLFTLALTLRTAWRGNRDARLLVGAMGVILLFAAHDWGIHSAHLLGRYFGGVLGGDVTLLQYSAPVLFMAIGWIMTNRYLRTLADFERLNAELDRRVQAREAELTASHVRLHELEMQRAVAEERERIHRDLHDDVGAKLLSLVYRADSRENAELARAALQDLRDTVSRSGGEATSLASLAADWRAECEKRLIEAGLTLDWTQRGDLDSPQLAQQQALHLGRVLREAVSNVIRHARAKQVRVTLEGDGRGVRLDVTDDGTVCPDPRPGGGLRNMAARAQRLGATLERYTPQAGGCGLRLALPLA